MSTEKPPYEIAQVACAKKDCTQTFNVIISSIFTTVTRAVAEIQFKTTQKNQIANSETVDDYIVVTCNCGQHTQRVYLKRN